MVIGVDASNIGVAGGATHLVEILGALTPEVHKIKEVYVWGREHLREGLPSKPWLHVRSPSVLDKSLPHRLWWQQVKLAVEARAHCDVLFVPGGLYLGSFRPYVTMMQNLIPFDGYERARYGVSLVRAKYHLLEWAQWKTFKNADGTIFLSQFSQDKLTKSKGELIGRTIVIPHGVSDRFEGEPGTGEDSDRSQNEESFRWLYVSPIRVYKHQWNVVRAAGMLREKGYPVTLDLVGHSNPRAMGKLRRELSLTDPEREFVHYHGRIPYREVNDLYHRANGFVFASTCETFGQVLLEAMQAGLPIACSNRSAAPEIARDAGEYFDPEEPREIAVAMRRLMENQELRARKARAGFERAQNYSWDRCAQETFNFISEVAEYN